MLPGFSATSSLYRSTRAYAGYGSALVRHRGGWLSGMVIPQGPDQLCMGLCMEICLGGGAKTDTWCRMSCNTICSGDDWREHVFGTGEEGAASLEFSLWFAIDALAIAWAYHDISSAVAGPTTQPPVAPLGCSGSYDIPGSVTGWSVPLLYPGCAGAWDHAQSNAQAICDKNLACPGKCPGGGPCRPVAILKARIDETRYLVTCEAEGAFRCECACKYP
jgi:hypothetical protein